MYYKLFLYGVSTKLFALVRIPYLEFSLHTKPCFNYEGKRYQVVTFILPASKVEFDDKGVEKTRFMPNKEAEIMAMPVPELYILEVPEF